MKKVYSFSSLIGSTITRYISLKQSLGRKYYKECEVLKNLDSFLYSAGNDLTAGSFKNWCHIHQHKASGVIRNNYMRVVYNLCLYRRRTKPKCFVPDKTEFPKLHQTIRPHIFTKIEIARLIHEATQVKSRFNSPMRHENFKLALILLYTTGLRIGELCRLTIGDYDPMEHTLLIRESKFHKSRLLPLSKDGWKEIEIFLRIRKKRNLSISKDFALLWNCNGNRKHTAAGFYTPEGLRRLFSWLFKKIGIHTTNGLPPRVHDFRHSFAVHALLRWYQEDIDVQTKLPSLSIYMGHVSIVSTEYYLRFLEDVIGVASQRFEQNCSKLITKFNKRGVI